MPGTVGSSYSVTVSDNDGCSSTASITVVPGPQTTLCDNVTVPIGQEGQLQPHSINGNGHNLNGADAPTYTYSASSDPGVATVDGSGKITAVGLGTATVDISSAATDNYEAALNKTVTITVEKAQPTVSGNASPSGTVGAVGQKNITATLSGSYPSGISLTASIGGHDVTVSQTGDGPVDFTFPASVLNALAAGPYPITVYAPATTENYAISSTDIGTLTVAKAQPALSGSGDRSATVGSVGDQAFTATLSNAYIGAGPLSLEAKLGALTVPAQASANGNVTFPFAAADLNALPVGGYPVTVSFAGDANHNAASATLGVLTLAKAQPALSGSGDRGATVGSVGDQSFTATLSDAYFGAGPLSLEAKLGALTVPAQATANGSLSFPFAAADLNALPVGGYPVTVSFAGDANHNAASATIGALTLTAPNQYAVTLHQQPGGAATATPGGGTAGTQIALDAQLEPGATFLRWDVSPAVTWTTGSATTKSAAFTLPAANVSVTPVYNVPVLRSVTLAQQPGGAATATPASAAPGATIQLNAAPEANYTFERWAVSPAVTFTAGDATSAAAAFTLPDADVTVTPIYSYHAPQAAAPKPKRATRPTIYVSTLQPYGFPDTGSVTDPQVKIRPTAASNKKAIATGDEAPDPLTILDIEVTSGYTYGYYKIAWPGDPAFAYIPLDALDVAFDPPLEGQIILNGYAFTEPREAKAAQSVPVKRGDRVRLLARSAKWWTAEIAGQQVYLPTWNVTFDFEETQLGIAEEAAVLAAQGLADTP